LLRGFDSLGGLDEMPMQSRLPRRRTTELEDPSLPSTGNLGIDQVLAARTDDAVLP